MSDLQRSAVLTEARLWLRTPYHHHGRVRGVGVDCAQLPIMVYSEVGLVPRITPTYSREWHLHRGEELYIMHILQFATEIGRDQAQPGDFGVWKYGRTFSHGAILVEPPMAIHARMGAGVEYVNIEQDEELRPGGRDARFFTLWGPRHGG